MKIYIYIMKDLTLKNKYNYINKNKKNKIYI